MRGALKLLLFYVLISHSFALFNPKNYRRQHRSAYLVNRGDSTPERRRVERLKQRNPNDEPEGHATLIYKKREFQHCARSLGKRCRIRPTKPDPWHTADPSQGTETGQTLQPTSFDQSDGHSGWQTTQPGGPYQTGSFQSHGYSYEAGGHYSSSGSTSSASGSYNAHSWGDSSDGQGYNHTASGSYDTSDESNHESGGVSGNFGSSSISAAWGSNPQGDGTSTGSGDVDNWLTDSVGDSGSLTATGGDALTTDENGEFNTGFATATDDTEDFGTQTGGGEFPTDGTAANTGESGSSETGFDDIIGGTEGPSSQTGGAPSSGPSQTGFDSGQGDTDDFNPQTGEDGFATDGFGTATGDPGASQTGFGGGPSSPDGFGITTDDLGDSDTQTRGGELDTEGFGTATDESGTSQTGTGDGSDNSGGMGDSNASTEGDGFATNGSPTATDEPGASQTGVDGDSGDGDGIESGLDSATGGLGDSDTQTGGTGFGTATDVSGASQTGGDGFATDGFATTTGEPGATQTDLGGATDGLNGFDQTGSEAHGTSGASATSGGEFASSSSTAASGSYNSQGGGYEWSSSSSSHSSSSSSSWSSSSNSSSYNGGGSGSYNNGGVHSWSSESGEYHTAGSYSGSHESYASSGSAAASGSYNWVRPGSGYVYGSASGTASGGDAPLPTWLAGSPKNDTPDTSDILSYDHCASETSTASYSSATESDFDETTGITDGFYSSVDASETSAPIDRDTVTSGNTDTISQPSITSDPSSFEDGTLPSDSASASEPSASSSSSNEDANGYLPGAHSGEGTHWEPSSGACGFMNNNEDLVAALPVSQFDGYPGAPPPAPEGNPNENPICGKKITVRHEGKSVTVTIVDRCEGCKEGDVDLSKSAFRQLDPRVDDGNNDPGRIDIEWEWA